MVLAIDVGNTHTVFGAWDGARWCAVWRRATHAGETEDELAVWLKGLFDLARLPFEVERVMIASVVPQVNHALALMSRKWLGCEARFLTNGMEVGLKVGYEPPTAVGADRIANALGALAIARPPLIVVDFGTATTFDTLNREGTYVGGAILPGVLLSSQSLSSQTAKLPQIELKRPERAVGRNTVESLQSGVILGYAGAIDHLIRLIRSELGGQVAVLATGGLGALFADLCEGIEQFEPNLTLDGLILASERLSEPGVGR